MKHYPIHVNQVAPHQCVHQFAAPVDEDVPARLPFQLLNFYRDLSLEQRRVPLKWLLQSSRGDELGKAVHPVGKRIARPQRPCGDELLIGHPPEQKSVTVRQVATGRYESTTTPVPRVFFATSFRIVFSPSRRSSLPRPTMNG